MNGGNDGLPEGWETVPIGTLCELINGRAFKSKEWSKTGLPIIRIQNLNNPEASHNYFDGDYDEKHLVRPGELLFAWSGTPGTSFGAHIWHGPEALLNQHIFRVVLPVDHLDKDFVCLAINHKIDEIIAHAHGGAGLRHIRRGKFEATEVVIPPLTEQRRIVAKVRTLQRHTQKMRKEMANVEMLISQHRQSILASAFSGTLTASWRAQHSGAEPASDLLKRILAERRCRWERIELTKYEAKGKLLPKGWKDKYKNPKPVDDSGLPQLPTSWCWSTLATVSEIQTGITLGQKKRDKSEYITVPYLRVANVQRGHLNLADIKEVDVTPERASELRLLEGDILFNEGGDRDKLGRGWVWRGEIKNCIHQNHVYRARLVLPKTIPELVSHYANHFGGNYFYRNATQSVNLASLNKSRLSGLPVPLIPVAEQAVIAKSLDLLLNIIDGLESELATISKHLSYLDHSVIAKSLRGELVTTEAELARRERREYEPASVLVDQIILEQDSVSKKRPSRLKGKLTVAKRNATSTVTRRVLVDILHKSRIRVSPEQLFDLSGFDESNVDEFYDELRRGVQAGQIVEERPNKDDIFLKLAQS